MTDRVKWDMDGVREDVELVDCPNCKQMREHIKQLEHDLAHAQQVARIYVGID